MENTPWSLEMVVVDSKNPSFDIEGEVFYTLYQKDFLQMPAVDFHHLIETDVEVRALMN